MEFHLIELPKLPQELKDEKDDILLWAKFINSERKEDFEMLATKNTYIQSAYNTLQVISQDEEKRIEYEAREKALRDYSQGMFEAEQRGEERGLEKGREEGIQALILDNLEEQITQERILDKLQKHFKLSEKDAKYYYEQYSKQD